MSRFQFPPRSARFVPAAFFILLCAGASTAIATDLPSLDGQWIGSSQLIDQHTATKTELSLHAPDTASATLRLDDQPACTLKDGSYSAQGADGWTLSFKNGYGGESCERLAKGHFSLRANGSRQLQFEVSYPGRDKDGTEKHRRGVLNRYP